MFLLDTNVCIGFLKGNAAVARRLGERDPREIRLCAVVKAELHYRARSSERVAENSALLEQFFRPFLSLPFDDGCAREYGALRAHLRRSGNPIGANDLMIAATALVHDLTVVTRNTREFARVPNLRLEDWQGET